MLLSRLWRRRLSAGTSRRNTTYLVKQSDIASHQKSGMRICCGVTVSLSDKSMVLRTAPAGYIRLGGDGWKMNRSSHSTVLRQSTLFAQISMEISRERSAETSATRERFTVFGGGGVAPAVAFGMRCECFAYRRNSDETPSVNPVKCASTPPLFDNCMRNLVLACGVMTMSRQAGLGLADLLVKTSTTSPCCNS